MEGSKAQYLENLKSKIRVKEFATGEILMEMISGGEVAAEAWFVNITPTDSNICATIYKLESLEVDEAFRGRGFASALLLRIDDFLKNTKSIAILDNGAHTEYELYDIKSKKKIDIRTVYERYGWRYIDKARGFMIHDKYADKKMRQSFCTLHYVV